MSAPKEVDAFAAADWTRDASIVKESGPRNEDDGLMRLVSTEDGICVYLPERVSGAGVAGDDGSAADTVLVAWVESWGCRGSGHVL